MASIPVNQIVRLALSEIRVARAGDVIRADDQDLAVLILNAYLESLANTPRAIYTESFNEYALTPLLQPHTIGPTGTWVVSRRPVELLSAALLVGTTRQTINIRTARWWDDNINTPDIRSSVPTDVYYAKKWPNGELNFWPVPSQARTVELQTSDLLSAVDPAGDLNLPDGYTAAIYLTLAELCAPSFGRQVSPDTRQKAIEARALLWGSNDESVDVDTWDGGMPNSMGGGSFDYRTGFSRR
jgi:hypothetical protein